MGSFVEKLAAAGYLTDEQVERIGRRTAEMVKAYREDPAFRKEANEKLGMNPMVQKMLKRVGYGTALGAGAVAGATAMNLVREKLKERSDSLKKAKDYKGMLEANPQLRGAEVDAQMVQRHFDTLHRFNPEYAADPMVAGTYVQNSLEMARPNIDALNNVVNARKNLIDAQTKARGGIPGQEYLKPLGGFASAILKDSGGGGE